MMKKVALSKKHGFTLIRTLLRKNRITAQPRGGFTLIELLVVISIIGVLIALSFVGFNQARKSARDSKRKADLEQIRSALEIYRNDQKTYPSSLPQLETDYMADVPSDPSNYSYPYSGITNSYCLCAFLETLGSDETIGDCTCAGDCDGAGTSCNYKVRNP
ncbi:MAG TPA: prepilin-type N-terminal cleavage/methylation domain-containing protein [Clostridia bacterium]|nr:prepilin-type N-terminal cleavage/methylation domain-containing protein [Clostridia bacterium]